MLLPGQCETGETAANSCEEDTRQYSLCFNTKEQMPEPFTRAAH